FRGELPASKRCIGHIADLTSSLEDWTGSLDDVLTTKPKPGVEEVVSLLDSLVPGEARLGSFDAVVSLNMLSQVGIYWRDRVESAVRRAGLAADDAEASLPASLDQALNRSVLRLESQHLAMLAASEAKSITVLYDSHFLYYTKSRSQWQEERGTEINPEFTIAGYQEAARDSWFWHIAPQDVEQPEHGSIHQVLARNFVRA